MAEPSQPQAGDPPIRIRLYALIGVVVVLVLGVSGVVERIQARSIPPRDAAAAPAVIVASPSVDSAGEELVLPGNLQAYSSALIHARTGGFLKAWYTDIGTAVKKGQLLAEIDAPELDQQYAQAQADLLTAQTNARLAQSTNVRWQGLVASESVSRQEAEEKASDAAAKKSIAESAAANVARLRELEGFKRITAPFDGVVVARNTDIGALINAGQATASELFRVADLNRLRVYVQVPQPYAGAIAPGFEASLMFAERPGISYPAKVARTANAIDPTTRTLQVQLELDNARRELFPGAYTEVHFKLRPEAGSLRLPATALLFRSAGLLVATVDKDNRVVLKKVVQGRNFTSTIEILTGVDSSDRVILNPTDAIVDGALVRVEQKGSTPPGLRSEDVSSPRPKFAQTTSRP